MDNRFIKNYPGQEQDEIYDLVDDACAQLPFSIVSPLRNYEDCIETKLYDRAVKCVIDFFEISIQFTSGFIISLLNHQEIPYDDDLREVLRKIVDKPLSFGDWVNDIFLVLVKKSQEYLPENILVKQLFQDLFLGPNGKPVTKKAEEFKQIVGFRNSFAHDTSLADEIYLEELARIEPRIWKMLAMLRPLSEYNFFSVKEVIEDEAESNCYVVFLDQGVKEINKETDGVTIYSDCLLEEHAYYVTDKKIRPKRFIEAKSVIRLSPFIIYHYNNEVNIEEKFHYVFQTVTSKNLKRMIFVSANKKAKRMETELFKEKFWTLLERIFGRLIHHDKYKINITNEKSLDEYSERLLTQTNIFLNQQINSDKYDPRVFLDRSYLSSSFEDFKKGDYPAYIILGDAGAGKTNQICHWASNTTSEIKPLAFYSKIFSQITLEGQLQQTFNEPGKSASAILEAFDLVLDKSGATACIFFDALNECHTYMGAEAGNGAIDLLTAIDTIFIREKFKHIKLVISCRSYTWEELLNKDALQKDRYYTVSDQTDGHITLKGFSETEFASVYPKYALKFELTTSLGTLLEDRYAFVKTRLYDPLILKTASQNFKGREFPADLQQFNSTRLFGQRLDALESKPDGPRQLSILEDFTGILWEGYTDSIPLKSLHRAYEDSSNPIHEFAVRIFKDDTYRYQSAFNGLLGEGILRIEKTIKKEVRFVYERFNEYLFARHFLLTHAAQRFRKIPVPASLYEQVLKNSGHSTVIIAALRNALIMDFYEKKHDPATIVQLSLSTLYESQPLVEETLSVLMDESYLDVLGILKHMLEYEKEESRDLFAKREEGEAILNKDKKKVRLSESAKNQVVEQLQEVNNQLLKIVKVRKIAISVIYKIFKSERAEKLIAVEQTDPNKLIWVAMYDPLPEVRDNASIYIYYIARYNTAMGIRIITALSEKVMSTPMTALLKQTTRKALQQSYIEPAARVGLFLVIDGLIERRDYKLALEIMNTWKRVVSKFTLNHALIKIVMPFFKFLFSRQTVVQTEYVNNAIEYRHFWDTVPVKAASPGWSQEAYGSLVPYLDASAVDFRRYEQVILNGYLTGDSFSLFLLERILIVQGIANWENVSDIVHQLSHLPESEPFKDYIEMSLIYSLSQINLKSPEKNPQAEQIFGVLVYSWSVRNKGFYYAHYNNIANGGRPYKHYILNWYAAAYCHHYGDGQTRPGDEYSAPVLRDLMNLAYKKKDKALLYNCIENIAMLVPSAGYYKTSLQLFEHLIGMFKTESELNEFDLIRLEGKLYEKGLRSFLCDMLGTVKSYYPKEVDHFIVNKLKAYQFPDLDAFREEIFNHSLSHEGIGDLLTHKFGNFVIWGILNDAAIRRFFIQICTFGPVARNYPEWFDHCIRHIFREVFGVKNI